MKLFNSLFILLLLVAAGGFVFMASWKVPLQTQHIEKTIDNKALLDQE